MFNVLLAVVGLGLLCGGWVLFQRWIARVDPEAPGVEGGCCGSAGREAPPTGELVVLKRRVR
jgi:hypothetical protein